MTRHTSFDLEYDGFTDVFTASILGLEAGEHTIKLVVADLNDGSLDSALFIEAGSLSAGSVIPEPSSALLTAVSLLALRLRTRRRSPG